MLNLTMSDDEFKIFSAFIYEKSGINYTENKKIILQNRVRKRLKELNMPSYKQYYDFIKSKTMDNPEMVKFFDEVTTNETSFFRHDKQFNALEHMIIPEILESKSSRTINIWSAAASMGKEAYTMAMVLSEMPKLRGYTINILGTDLNAMVLEMAKNGEYPMKDFKDIKPHYKKYITVNEKDGVFFINKELKTMVNFKRFNLKDSFVSIPKMDVIFCRNVFIYFQKSTQSEIVSKFYEKLNNKGFFILGHSETLNGVSEAFKYRKFNGENLMIYQKDE